MATKAKLPSDALFEILTRSSLETVGRCRSISKEWNRVTYESSFHQLLCERTNTVSGFFIQSKDRSEYSSTFVPLDTNANFTSLSLDYLEVPVRIEAMNQGVLVCVNQKERYLVCKPSTKQWVKIPNPKTKYQTASTALLVLNSKPLKYKVIRFSEAKVLVRHKSKDWRHIRCEIFDSTTWEWKRSKDVILPSDVFFVNMKDDVVAANGGLYWLLPSKQVFAFYEDVEKWEMFSLPPSAIDNAGYNSKLLLVEHRGRLALIHSQNELMDIWEMQNYTRKLWSERQTWNINKGKEDYVDPLAFHNGDTALMKGYYKLIIYNFQQRKSRKIRLRSYSDPDRIFKFQSDTEEVNLKDPPEEQSDMEEVYPNDQPEETRGSAKFLLMEEIDLQHEETRASAKLLLGLAGFSSYLLLILVPWLFRSC